MQASLLDQSAITQCSGTYITFFATLDPILKPMEPTKHKFESQESESLLALSNAYATECKKKFPDRQLKTTVVDLKGESVFLTR